MDTVQEVNPKIKLFDPRGGYNRYSCNFDFFKKWTDEMAYVLGFLYADGAVIDAVSSRTQYIKFSSKDREIIEKIKAVLESEHPIHFRSPQISQDKYGHIYRSSKSFYLRIGSREVFSDLIKLGLIPNKSKSIEFPPIPPKYLSCFVRGYFDGDGTIYIEKRRGTKRNKIIKRARTIFSDGSKAFIDGLSNVLAETLKIRKAKVYNSSRCFHIAYSIKETIKIFKSMYKNSHNLFLKRKFNIFEQFFNIRTEWLDKEVTEILNENRKYLAT